MILTPREYSTEIGSRIRLLLSKHRIVEYSGSPLLCSHINLVRKSKVKYIIQIKYIVKIVQPTERPETEQITQIITHIFSVFQVSSFICHIQDYTEIV